MPKTRRTAEQDMERGIGIVGCGGIVVILLLVAVVYLVVKSIAGH